mgnify:CR=1 FL=1
MTEPLRQTAERALRRFAPPLYRWLQRRSGQRLAKRTTNAAKIDTCKYYFIAWIIPSVSLASPFALGPL